MTISEGTIRQLAKFATGRDLCFENGYAKFDQTQLTLFATLILQAAQPVEAESVCEMALPASLPATISAHWIENGITGQKQLNHLPPHKEPHHEIIS